MAGYKTIYWLPRILSLAFVTFLSLFALDVFGQYTGWPLMVALLIHLVPSFILLAIILIAWKYELVGAIVFLLAAIGYVLMVGLNRPWSWYTGISGPALIVSILFFIAWRKKNKIPT